MNRVKKYTVWVMLAGMMGLVSGCERRNRMELYEVEQIFETESGEASETQVHTEEKIYVDVCGAVRSPGVYQLDKGDRAFQAIEMAGGMHEEALKEAVNQASLLSDGQQLYVPFQGEEVLLGTENADQRINLNTAGKEELMTLPGIGESRAEAVIAWREEQGAFQSTEEIKNISGIGDAMYEKLKDKIKVQ